MVEEYGYAESPLNRRQVLMYFALIYTQIPMKAHKSRSIIGMTIRFRPVYLLVAVIGICLVIGDYRLAAILAACLLAVPWNHYIASATGSENLCCDFVLAVYFLAFLATRSLSSGGFMDSTLGGVLIKMLLSMILVNYVCVPDIEHGGKKEIDETDW